MSPRISKSIGYSPTAGDVTSMRRKSSEDLLTPLMTPNRRLALVLLVLLLSWFELYVFLTGSLFESSDFASYLDRYQNYSPESFLDRESWFYYTGSAIGSWIGYLPYHLLLIHLTLLLYFRIIWSIRSDAAFIAAALYPVSFIGFDSFFFAIRSTFATLLFVSVYRIVPGIVFLYFIHFGVFLQSGLSVLTTRRRLILFIIVLAAVSFYALEPLIALYDLIYAKFTLYEGEGALEGLFNIIFIGFFVANLVMFESRSKLLMAVAMVIFAAYMVAIALSIPYAYRFSYFPILLQQCSISRFRFGFRTFGVYLLFLATYLGLVAVRIV